MPNYNNNMIVHKDDDSHSLDDGLSNLTADEYVKLRLQPMISAFSLKSPPLSFFTHTVTTIVIILSVCSSILSTFGLTVFIPVTLAFSGACASWKSYKQVDLRLLQANNAINQLNQVNKYYKIAIVEF